MARPKLYKTRLTQEERDLLDKTIRNKSTCKTVLKRCQILRQLDEASGTSLTHDQITHTYAVCLATVDNTTNAYINKGIHEIITYISVLILPTHCVKQTAGLRLESSVWPAAKRQMDMPGGHLSCWKIKHVSSWIPLSAVRPSGGL